VAEALGLRTAAFLAPIGALVAATALWFSPVRHLRTLPAEPIHGAPRLPGAAEATGAAGAAGDVARDEPIGG
jgi:hypothetical protein